LDTSGYRYSEAGIEATRSEKFRIPREEERAREREIAERERRGQASVLVARQEERESPTRGEDGRNGRNMSIPGNSGDPSRASSQPPRPPRVAPPHPKMFPKRGGWGGADRAIAGELP